MTTYQYQLLPELAENEYSALKADIAKNGVQVPVELDQDGTIIDGHHRIKAWTELKAAGIELPDYPRMVRHFDDEDSRIEQALKLNLQRRHLSREQLKQVAVDLRWTHGWTLERIAEKLGVGKSTIDRWVPTETTFPSGKVEEARAVGADGKSRPMSYKPRPAVIATSEREERAAINVLRVPEEYIDLVIPQGVQVVTVQDAKKEVGSAKAKDAYVRRKEAWDDRANTDGGRFEVRRGDFREVLADIEDGSVDAIVTDPPYPDEFLPLWGELATWAARKLRPGSPLIAWSGQYRMQQVLNYLCGPLTYQWTICLDMPGTNARFRGPNMLQGWKPIVVCTAGTWGPHDWFADRVTSPAREQDLFEWQQNAAPAVELIERYVPAGGLVIDPFTGVGSFGVAALSAGRRFIGAELDDDRYMTACERIGGAA